MAKFKPYTDPTDHSMEIIGKNKKGELIKRPYTKAQLLAQRKRKKEGPPPPKKKKGESNKNFNLRKQAYLQSFNPQKAPTLLKGETGDSFRNRVQAWEGATGKEFPKTFSGKTDEERVLSGESMLSGLNITKDYSYEYRDEITDYQRTLKKDSTSNPYSEVDTTPLNQQELQINKAAEKFHRDNEKRMEEANRKERQEISDDYKASYDPWDAKNFMPVGTTDAQFTKNGGYKTSLNIPQPVPSDAQDLKGLNTNSGSNTSSSNTYKRMNPIERENRKRFGDEKIDALKIRHADWKKARKAGTLDQWRKKYGVN